MENWRKQKYSRKINHNIEEIKTIDENQNQRGIKNIEEMENSRKWKIREIKKSKIFEENHNIEKIKTIDEIKTNEESQILRKTKIRGDQKLINFE